MDKKALGVQARGYNLIPERPPKSGMQGQASAIPAVLRKDGSGRQENWPKQWAWNLELGSRSQRP